MCTVICVPRRYSCILFPMDGHAATFSYTAASAYPHRLGFCGTRVLHDAPQIIHPLFFGGNRLPQLKHMSYCIHSKQQSQQHM